jgi:hypothetical protein
MNKNKIKKYILGFLLLELLFAYTSAYAQNNTSYDYSQGGTNPVSSQIEKYLCAPSPVITSQTSNTNTMFAGMQITQQQAAANNANGGDLYRCINQLYKFAIVVASVGGVLFIVIAGYIYMSANGEAESVTKAKNILETTITAIVILLAGYVLLKAINPDLIQFQPIQPPSVVPTSTLVSGGAAGGGAASTVNPSICQAAPTSNCSTSACDKYAPQINAAAQTISISGVNTAALIKSIIINESGCNPGAASAVGSYGLMQLQVSTANQSNYKSACGVNVTVDSSWLTNPSNSDKVICIGAQYLKDLSSSCSGILNIAAGYNGGAKACAQSVDCTGTSCDGTSAMRAWECLFDDTQHTVPNTGYNESRNYAPKVLGCYQQY